jgi:hypothetical protein
MITHLGLVGWLSVAIYLTSISMLSSICFCLRTHLLLRRGWCFGVSLLLQPSYLRCTQAGKELNITVDYLAATVGCSIGTFFGHSQESSS